MPKGQLLDSKRTDDDFWSKVSCCVNPMPPPAFVAPVTGVSATPPTVTVASSSSDVTPPTEAAGTVDTTQPTEASGAKDTTQPTEAAPSDTDDISSGNNFNKISFSICTSLFLACALGFAY